MAKALGDIRVVEMAQGLAGALAGRLLAELGAEVIKVEPPGGDRFRTQPPCDASGSSYLFHLLAANKESICLDLSEFKDSLAVVKLVQTADVLIEDSPQGAMYELGLGYNQIRSANPRLVYCSLTGFGRTGPLSDKAYSDLILQATSGHMAVTGFLEDPPTKAGPPLAYHTGGLYGALAIIAGLVHRDRRGRGQYIDLSMYDCLVNFLAIFLPECFVTGKAQPRQGNRHPLSAPWNSYQAKDGWVVIVATAPRHWEGLLKTMGREDLIGDERYDSPSKRRARRDELDAIVADWARDKTVSEIVTTLDEARVPVGPICTIDQLLADPHFLSRRMVVQLGGLNNGGKVTTIGSVFNSMSQTPGNIDTIAPGLGQHNEKLLSSLPKSAGPIDLSQIEVEAPSSSPLEGIRVLELGSRTTGPFAARLLAGLGAEVIKVEPPDGEYGRTVSPLIRGTSYYFLVTNTNKKSIVVDLQVDSGREALMELAQKADILIENNAAGVTDRLGVGYSALSQANPNIIYCSISGFGQKGPYRHKVALDTAVQAMSGIMSVTGYPHRPPTKIGVSIVDLLGASFGALATLAALHYRNRGGQGQFVDISMHDCAGWLTQMWWPHYLANGQPPSRQGNRDPYSTPSNSYQAGDGLVVIAAENETQWQGLLATIERQDWADDPCYYGSMEDRMRLAEDVDEIVSRFVGARTVEEVVEMFGRLGVPVAPVAEVHEVVSHPHTLSRHMIVEFDHEVLGKAKATGFPFKLSLAPEIQVISPPKPGQHTDEVFRELLGYSAEKVRELRLRGETDNLTN